MARSFRPLPVWTCVCAVSVIFAPAIAFVVRGPGHNTENRAQEGYRGTEAGWSWFGNFGDYISDRIPLKTDAVRADVWIDERVFGEDPAFGGAASPRVVRGQQGFLFIKDAIDVACTPHAPAALTITNLKELAGIIADSGRDVLTMVAPDKSSVHTELLPPDLAQRGCFDAFTDELWTGLNDAGIEGFVDLRRALIEESRSSREPLYLRKDTHWDSAGSLVAVHAMVDHFAPGLWTDDEVKYQGVRRYIGDLTTMQGHPEGDDTTIYSISRPDVASVSVDVIDDIEGGYNRRFINTAPPGRLIEGRTVVFLDSFGLGRDLNDPEWRGNSAFTQYVPFFADVTIIRLVDFEPERFLRAIQDADRVWILSVERSTPYRLAFEIGSREFLDLLHQQLTPRR